MSETALEIKTRPLAGSPASSGAVFLCHNSKDKPAVKRIADALELEFGTRFFLDAYAIPSGEAFIPWIEQSLVQASGVAIFLGVNGWGPTHLWEAERALARYREDPQFKLIPVALPGISQDDMRRLGSGKVFQEINWADFTKSPEDRDSLEKLEAALSGRTLPQHRGPARLTPYQIRRDAERWARSGAKDRSILYSGAQLEDAARLIRDNPDFVVVAEVLPFLDAARDNQNRFWRRMAVAGASTALALAALAATAGYASWLAEQRRVASLSRQLAIVSRDAPSADRRLLTAAQAVLTDPTTEARGALLERLQEARYLRRIVHSEASIESAIIDNESGDALVGTWDGRLRRTAASSGSTLNDVSLTGTSTAAITALTAADGQVWLGRSNGRIDVIRINGPSRVALPPVAQPPRSRDLGIRALAKQADGPLLVAGTGSGRLAVVDTRDGTVRLDLDEGDDVRVTAATFDASGRWLAAGTGHGEILLIDTSDFVIRQRYPKLEGGVLALGFAHQGDLVAVADNGALVTFRLNKAELQRTGTFPLPALLTSAAINRDARRIAVGDGSGVVYLYDPYGQAMDLGETRAHANRVSALAFGADGHTLVSGASDGTVALWDLLGRSGPSIQIPNFGPEASGLRTRPDGTLVAAYSYQGRAGVWRLDGTAWVQEVDLFAATRAALGDDSLGPPDGEPAAVDGFEPIDVEIPFVSLDATAHRVAWLTRRGALLQQDLTDQSKAVVVDTGRGHQRGELAVSGNGRTLAFLDETASKAGLVELSRLGEPVHFVDLPAEGRSLALDAAGRRLAVGLEDGRAVVFRAERGWRPFAEPLKLHDAAVAGISFAADGERLISFGSGGGGADRTIVVSAANSLEFLRRLQSRQAGGSVAVTATGTRSGILAAADHDGQVLLWSLADLRFIAELNAGSSVVSALHIDDARHLMFAYSADGSFTSWSLSADKWVALACAKANRNFRVDEWAELLPDDPFRSTCESRAVVPSTLHGRGERSRSSGHNGYRIAASTRLLNGRPDE